MGSPECGAFTVLGRLYALFACPSSDIPLSEQGAVSGELPPK